jgi:ribosome biogenesis protein Nip4
MFALISSEKLEDYSQIMIKQLKNRYNDPTLFRKFVVGIDRAKMRLYDVEESAQADIADEGPVFGKSKIGQSIDSEKKDKFKGLLV